MLEGLLSGDLGITEGCRQLYVLRSEVSEVDNKLFFPFTGVYSETDSFPLGEIRKKWSPSALDRADRERSRVEDHYRDFVLKASTELLTYAMMQIQDS